MPQAQLAALEEAAGAIKALQGEKEEAAAQWQRDSERLKVVPRRGLWAAQASVAHALPCPALPCPAQLAFAGQPAAAALSKLPASSPQPSPPCHLSHITMTAIPALCALRQGLLEAERVERAAERAAERAQQQAAREEHQAALAALRQRAEQVGGLGRAAERLQCCLLG